MQQIIQKANQFAGADSSDPKEIRVDYEGGDIEESIATRLSHEISPGKKLMITNAANNHQDVEDN